MKLTGTIKRVARGAYLALLWQIVASAISVHRRSFLPNFTKDALQSMFLDSLTPSFLMCRDWRRHNIPCNISIVRGRRTPHARYVWRSLHSFVLEAYLGISWRLCRNDRTCLGELSLAVPHGRCLLSSPFPSHPLPCSSRCERRFRSVARRDCSPVFTRGFKLVERGISPENLLEAAQMLARVGAPNALVEGSWGTNRAPP